MTPSGKGLQLSLSFSLRYPSGQGNALLVEASASRQPEFTSDAHQHHRISGRQQHSHISPHPTRRVILAVLHTTRGLRIRHILSATAPTPKTKLPLLPAPAHHESFPPRPLLSGARLPRIPPIRTPLRPLHRRKSASYRPHLSPALTILSPHFPRSASTVAATCSPPDASTAPSSSSMSRPTPSRASSEGMSARFSTSPGRTADSFFSPARKTSKLSGGISERPGRGLHG